MENWIFPGSTKNFNPVELMKNQKYMIWLGQKGMQIGDIAYVYIGNPYSAIKFKCKIIDDQIDETELENNSYAIDDRVRPNGKYVKLQLISEYPDTLFPWKEIKDNGLGQVQRQQRATSKILKYIAKKEVELTQLVSQNNAR